MKSTRKEKEVAKLEEELEEEIKTARANSDTKTVDEHIKNIRNMEHRLHDLCADIDWMKKI